MVIFTIFSQNPKVKHLLVIGSRYWKQNFKQFPQNGKRKRKTFHYETFLERKGANAFRGIICPAIFFVNADFHVCRMSNQKGFTTLSNIGNPI